MIPEELQEIAQRINDFTRFYKDFADNDDEFMNYCIEKIPRIFAEIERLQSENERLRKQCDALAEENIRLIPKL